MSERDFIDGVFNYCDRWCERCPLTERCRLYAIDRDASGEAENREPSNEMLWQSIQDALLRTERMIRQKAAEMGVDLDALMEATDNDERSRGRDAASHHLVAAAHAYARHVDDWFRDASECFAAKQDELNHRLSVDPEDEYLENEAVAIGDAVDVIRWYQYMIAAKLSRAVSYEPLTDDESPRQNDANGSAKVALLSADRSLAAWGLLRDQIPDQSDAILDLLTALDRLRRGTEAEFPQARVFRRPGFDEQGGPPDVV